MVNEGFCEEELKPFGPVHEYVEPPPAFVVLREIVPPSHKLVGVADAGGVAGLELIATVVIEVLVQPFASVTFTVYVPAAAVVTLVRDGFC